MKKKRQENDLPLIPMTRDKLDTLGMILSDPQGSYTGRPTNLFEMPVQDADDL